MLEARLVLNIAQKAAGDAAGQLPGANELKEVNQPVLSRLLAYHEFGPFAYSELMRSSRNLPGGMMDSLKAQHYFTLLQNACFREEFLRLAGIFSAAGLIVLPIKGLALLGQVYEAASPRIMVDMDVLVEEEALDRAAAILLENGYDINLHKGSLSYWRKKNCNIPFKNKERGWSVELHFSLDIKRSGRDILPGIWQRLKTQELNGENIKTLSPEDTLFSLVLHQRRFGKRLCLKNTLDTALLIKQYRDSLDWDYVLRQAHAEGMRSAVYFALLQAALLLNSRLPGEVWKGLRVPFLSSSLMRRIIKRDTFSTLSSGKAKYLCLKCHFLLYDDLRIPFRHLFGITREEFAKFYGLPIYAPGTERLYRARFIYEPYMLIRDRIWKTGSC